MTTSLLTSAQKLENLLERYNESLGALESSAIARMNVVLDTSFKLFEQDLRKAYADIAGNKSLLPSQRKLLILDKIGGLMGLVNPTTAKRYQDIIQDLIQQATATGTTGGRELTAIATGGKVDLNTFSDIPIEALAAASRDSVNRLARHGQEFADKATAAIEQGIIQGWGINRLTSALRGVLGITKGRAETIARTETISAFNRAAEATYIKNDIPYIQSIATSDDLTCSICGARNGQVYEIGKISIPYHPKCRCFSTPWKPSWLEAGLINDAYYTNLSSQIRQELQAQGKDFDYGVAPFERAAGLTKAPEPVWKPGMQRSQLPPENPRRSEAVVTTEPAPTSTPDTETVAPAPPPPPKFPNSLEELEEVRILGGSTGARLMRNPVTGQQYVLKQGASDDHIAEEMQADKLYQAVGANVPDFREYRDRNGRLTKLAEYIEGETLKDYLDRAIPEERLRIKQRLQEDFAMDALLGNWDVIGLDLDNVLVDAQGNPWRIDNGGALRFRAQGDPKGSAWNKYPQELWSLRSPSNRAANLIFGDMSYSDVIASMRQIYGKRKLIREAIADNDINLDLVVKQRLKQFEELTSLAETMLKDKWKDSYLDDFQKHLIGIQAAGIGDRFPKELRQKFPKRFRQRKDLLPQEKPALLIDENGKEFDDLRGDRSIHHDLVKYINTNGGDYNKIIKEWGRQQANDSWYDRPRAYKYFLYLQRNVSANDFFWMDGRNYRGRGFDYAKDTYRDILSLNNISEEVYRQSYASFHAFNYLVFSRVRMTNKDPNKGVLRLVRTESDDVMDIYNKTRTTGQFNIKRGMAESTSLLKPVTPEGSNLTYQEVPYHRIVGSYFLNRDPGDLDDNFFLSDNENEIVAIMDGLEVEYTGDIGRGDFRPVKPNFNK